MGIVSKQEQGWSLGMAAVQNLLKEFQLLHNFYQQLNLN